MPGQFITHNTSTFHYRQFGWGAKLLFCFHGYGKDSYSFEFLERVLGKQYSIIAIDAPYHGHTQWDDPVFRPKDLVQVLEKIGTALGKNQGKISLLGYSMGGRIALGVMQSLAHKIERVVLLAPDGLRYYFWQWFSTHTWLGNKIFDYTIHHPNGLLNLVDLSGKLGFLHKNLIGFIHYYMDNEEERMILYRRWIIMKKFKPRLSSLKKIITKNKIKVRMAFGRYDKIILYASGHKFLKTIEAYATVQIIDTGHDVLRERHAGIIANLFND